ncbi:MAG: O-antigen ligase family protein [Candidatus Eiseniibacteriota bacterium]|nr:MAG: O-antigen ligase family protein [Candidatus Eisenbacteria bacterium]
MPVAESVRRMKDKAPSFMTILKVVLPVGLGYLLGSAIVNPYHRTIEILVGFFIAAAAFLIKPSRAIAAFIVIFLFPAHLSIGTSNTVFILILLSTWVAQQVISGQKITVRTPLDLPIVVMAAAYLLSLSNVPHGLYGVNLRGLTVFLTSVAIYYLVVNLTNDTAGIRRLLWAGAIGAAIMAGIGLYEVFNPGRQLLPYFLIMREAPSDVPIVRAGSGFRNSSVLSQYCLFYILAGAFMFTRETSRFLRTVIALLLSASLIIFVSTAMRGALLAGAAGLVFLVWRSRGIFDTRKLVIVVLACAVVFLVAHQVLNTAGFVPNIWGRFSELQQKVGSHVDRVAVMREVFDRSMEHPFIGHGPVIHLPRGFVTVRSNNPHCQYLLYLYTIGLLGLAGFIWLLVGLFRLSSQSIRRGDHNKFLQGLMVILQTFLVIFVLHETVDDYSSSFNYPLFIWYTFALVVTTRNVLLREASAAEQVPGAGSPGDLSRGRS